jgi:type IV secretion system protein VirD4
VMQLLQSDEIVMVAGLPPIHAQKMRYYEDRTFRARCLATPVLPALGVYPDRCGSRPDDWTRLPILTDAPPRTYADPQQLATGGEGGRRREPELPEHEEIAALAAKRRVSKSSVIEAAVASMLSPDTLICAKPR